MYVLKAPERNKELPLKIRVSFEKIYEYLEVEASDTNSVIYSSANILIKELNKFPILKEGFEDLTLLEKHK
ncbi:hypothetical protein N9901_03735, partial [Flavobacteriaceae bacterium]|nr:hypothetical protein [Flavobacteriaceae bacterium]